jgi:hypothetical protein
VRLPCEACAGRPQLLAAHARKPPHPPNLTMQTEHMQLRAPPSQSAALNMRNTAGNSATSLARQQPEQPADSRNQQRANADDDEERSALRMST